MIDALRQTLLSLFESFAWPGWLLALPLPWLVRWLLPPVAGASAALRVPWGDRLASIGGRVGPARAKPAGLLPWLAWALLCLAAARPQQLGEVVQPPQTSRNLMLALDLSGSMDERDIELGGRTVSRLTAAKAVISDFLERRRGDRVGLVIFGERAFALTPLTRDLDTVREQLDSTVSGIAGRATAIGDAIALSTKRLQAQPADQRLLVLLTDGMSNAGALDPMKAAAIARDAGVRVHTIAFGGYGAGLSVFGVPIRMPGTADTTDEDGLRKIAELTGGRAYAARDADQLAGIYAEIDRLEPVKLPGQRLRPRIERYPWPLGGAIACALLALLLRRRATGGAR
jgi:Ca-activated chloride channel family protein